MEIPKQDFFNINPNIEVKEKLEERLDKQRMEWTAKIKEMGLKMKHVANIPELMTELYTERQQCVEYHHYLISILININKDYRKQYAERHDYWSYKSNIRYPNEPSKNNKILTELSDIVERREAIDNHAKFMTETCKSIDAIIYAVKNRVEIEQISRGK